MKRIILILIVILYSVIFFGQIFKCNFMFMGKPDVLPVKNNLILNISSLFQQGYNSSVISERVYRNTWPIFTKRDFKYFEEL